MERNVVSNTVKLGGGPRTWSNTPALSQPARAMPQATKFGPHFALLAIIAVENHHWLVDK